MAESRCSQVPIGGRPVPSVLFGLFENGHQQQASPLPAGHPASTALFPTVLGEKS